MKTFIFVDSSVAAYQDLSAGALPGSEVIILNPLTNGIHQISAALAHQSDISALHIVSHGNEGGIYLGNTLYDINALEQYSGELQSWAKALTPDADIFAYGCNVASGEAGQNFVRRLSQLTDADVAASDDLTGSAALGGDWSLEFKTGSIEAPLAFAQQTLENYNAILPFISDIPWTSAVNGWGPVERDRSNGEMPAGDGGTLTLNGVTYSKGLGIHANSTVTYNLGGTYSRFISDVGIDDSEGSRGSVVFRVVADGVQLFDSGLMTGASATRTVDVDISGRQNLQLIVTNGGDNIDFDHGNWAGARLLRSSISPPPPPSLPPLARSSFITGLNQPTTLQWSPDGSRMYIAQKDGTVRVAVNGQLQAQPFINIADQVNNVTDRGLLGLEVDPFLGQNRGRDFVYLLYTSPFKVYCQGTL